MGGGCCAGKGAREGRGLLGLQRAIQSGEYQGLGETLLVVVLVLVLLLLRINSLLSLSHLLLCAHWNVRYR
jgi:hypothetical protein